MGEETGGNNYSEIFNQFETAFPDVERKRDRLESEGKKKKKSKPSLLAKGKKTKGQFRRTKMSSPTSVCILDKNFNDTSCPLTLT